MGKTANWNRELKVMQHLDQVYGGVAATLAYILRVRSSTGINWHNSTAFNLYQLKIWRAGRCKFYTLRLT